MEIPKGRQLNIVIAGAGPTGLLLAASLLDRNRKQGIQHTITLIDGRPNLGLVDPLELMQMKSHRSWPVFLNALGIAAVKQVPGLYENYVMQAGKAMTSLVLHVGKHSFTVARYKDEADKGVQRGLDRNMLVGSIARYLQDRFSGDSHYAPMFDTKIMYVDHERKRVLLRREKKEEYLSYDILIGCDGLRSVVREAFVKRHPKFCFDIQDTQERMKVVHFKKPPHFDDESFHVLGKCLGEARGIAFPDSSDEAFCMAVGLPEPSFDKVPTALFSKDPSVVADYMKKNLTFQLDDWDDVGQQWVNQRWNRVMEVHCSLYHSLDAGIAIMGDAAHATSPALGMGLNTGLRDAQVFVQLMDFYRDDPNLVLPAFSEERVKDGHALTNLSHCVTTLNPDAGTRAELEILVRKAFHRFFPWLVSPHPRDAINANPQLPLTEAYRLAREIGWLQRQEKDNGKIAREHFEREIGLLPPKKKRRLFWKQNEGQGPESPPPQETMPSAGLDILLAD